MGERGVGVGSGGAGTWAGAHAIRRVSSNSKEGRKRGRDLSGDELRAAVDICADLSVRLLHHPLQLPAPERQTHTHTHVLMRTRARAHTCAGACTHANEPQAHAYALFGAQNSEWAAREEAPPPPVRANSQSPRRIRRGRAVEDSALSIAVARITVRSTPARGNSNAKA